MLIRGDRRLELTPYQDEFKLYEFDPATGRDLGRMLETGEGERERRELLAAMAEHFGLDTEALQCAARERGFLGRLVSKGE